MLIIYEYLMPAALDLKNADALELLNTPFDTAAVHTEMSDKLGAKTGYYNIQNIGIFLWRLKAYPIINAPAVGHENDKRKLFFNQLGYDMHSSTIP